MPTPMRHLGRCARPGCDRQATLRGRHCRRHYAQLMNRGDFDQRRLYDRELVSYRAEATAFVARFHDHPATLAALAYLEGARELAHTSPLGRLRKAWTRIITQGITNEEILVTVLTMYLARYRDPRLFVSDVAFKFQVGRAVLYLRPLGKNALGKKVVLHGPIKRDLGDHLLTLLAPYLGGAVRWIEDVIEAQRKREQAIRTAFPVEA